MAIYIPSIHTCHFYQTRACLFSEESWLQAHAAQYCETDVSLEVIEKEECLKSWVKSGITQDTPINELEEQQVQEGDTSVAAWLP